MQKTVMFLALFLLISWGAADAQAGRGNGKGKGRGAKAKPECECECEDGKGECADADTCSLCGAEEKKEAGGKKKGKKKDKGKKKGKKAKSKSDGEGCGGGCDGRGEGRGNGNGRGRGSCEGNGAGGGCEGRGEGRGRGNGQGRGKGKGNGNGNGKGNGKGKGNGSGKNGGDCGCDGEKVKGEGGTCGLTDTDTPAKPASAEYLARLQATLEEEIYARDYYLAAYEALDGFRRFGNLARAEQNHADAISAAIERLGGKPDLTAKPSITVPGSIAAADTECTAIEKKVIAIYAGLITDCPDAAVKKSLERIQEANRRHLAAVSR